MFVESTLRPLIPRTGCWKSGLLPFVSRSYRTPRLIERFVMGRQSSWTNAAIRFVFAVTSAEPTP